jgi:ABC-type microcin C transport system permease subunit YejB
MDEQSVTTTANIAVRYIAANNPEGNYFDCVPLRDLTQDEWDALKPWVQAGLLDSTWYVKPEA